MGALGIWGFIGFRDLRRSSGVGFRDLGLYIGREQGLVVWGSGGLGNHKVIQSMEVADRGN